MRAAQYLIMFIQVACLLVIIYGAYLALGTWPLGAVAAAALVLAASLYVESRLSPEEK
jgi:hypothetical protein